MLELQDVTLTYPDGDRRLTALDRVELRVADGEAAAITGPSGSGKSSLLAVAATLTAPDRGRVLLGGRDIVGASRREAARIRRSELGIMFQTPNLHPALRVREQLEVMAKLGAGDLAGLGRGELARRIAETLELVGIGELADRRPAQLSGGQRQRANLARAIVHRPATLLVDEPTSALDRARGDAIIELVTGLTRELGLATVLVTHEQEHLARFDAVYEMADGVLSRRGGRAASVAPSQAAALRWGA